MGVFIPDWTKRSQPKYALNICHQTGKPFITRHCTMQTYGAVYYPTKEAAQRAFNRMKKGASK